MNSTGSIWRKWDLHIHTPASYHWKGKRFEACNTAERDELCAEIIDKINSTDVCAFCIMDYWTFDGYLLLRDYIERNPDSTDKTIFPGIELRMVAPTDFRLNTHVLLSDTVSAENLAHFISHLKLADHETRPPTRQHLIELAQSYDGSKLDLYGCTNEDKTDEDKMHIVGLKSAIVTRESVNEAIKVVGEEHCLVIQPYDTSDGLEDLDWKRHPYTDSYLMKWAHCFESRDPIHVNLFLGKGHKTKPHVGPDFINNLGGYPKPVFSGSDAHRISKYGVYPSERATWLKAQPTFKGLQQICYEPALRCHIGDVPPKLLHVSQNRTKYMECLKINKADNGLPDEQWFDRSEIELNPGLIAIIGNRGSGKSALADIIALAGNAHCLNMEFLNKDRFRGTGNKAKHFNVTLTWADETEVVANLDDETNEQEPQRVRYLPQRFIETLCNEISSGNGGKFEKALENVIFLHLPEEDQLEKSSLEELIEYRVEARRDSLRTLRQSLCEKNEDIWKLEQETSEKRLTEYESALALKESELKAHNEIKPEPVEEPSASTNNDGEAKEKLEQLRNKEVELRKLQEELDEAKTEVRTKKSKQASLERLKEHVANLKAEYDSFVENHNDEFVLAGLSLEQVISFTVNYEPIEEEHKHTLERLAEISSRIEGEAATDEQEAVKGLEILVQECTNAVSVIQAGLDAPQKAYETYREALRKWEECRDEILGKAEKSGTIEFYKHCIRQVKDAIPAQKQKLLDDRIQLVRDIHAELQSIRDIYKKLYEPVQKIASQAATAEQSTQMEFDASIAASGFQEGFNDFIHRGRRGNFTGDDGTKIVTDLLHSHDFNELDCVVFFVEAVMKKLTILDKEGEEEEILVEPQLRKGKHGCQLYDFIFGLEYLDVKYNLRMDGKEISQLSPGEKGGLLLVFYLMLDMDEIPIIIDQPEHNLDNESIVQLLVACIRKARDRRQVILVTHNPNLAVYCDADQIIHCKIDKANGHKIEYTTGAIEEYDINALAVNVLEGTYEAFDNRRKKWHKPQL
jgi:ABC-type lipoprotein export system ATPase subunit